MAVRSTMSDLITRTRRLISDPSSASSVFDDQTVQDVLDAHRVDTWYQRLIEQGTRPPGGGFIQYLDYYTELGNWEQDAQLTDASYNVLLPYDAMTQPYGWTAEWIVGHWKFLAQPNPPGPPLSPHWPLYITGKYFDLFGAGAELCRQWAAKLKLEFDVRTKERQYARNQQIKALLEMAEEYDAKAWAGSAPMVRNDVSAVAPTAGPFFGTTGNEISQGPVR